MDSDGSFLFVDGGDGLRRTRNVMPLNMLDNIDATIQRHLDHRVFGGHGFWRPLSGSINDVWRVTSDDGINVIVRIGPSAEVVKRGPSWMRINALGCEQRVLSMIRPHVVQIPATIAAGFLPGHRPWLVQELVSGMPLSDALNDLRCDEQVQIWREVGNLLRRLRQIPGPWFGTPDGGQRFPDWPSMVAKDATGLLEDARQMELPLEPFSTLCELAERHHADLEVVDRPSIVHSDLDPRHIFVDRDDDGWCISGVIDWEFGRYVDPDFEGLLLYIIDLPANDPARVAFLDGFGPVDAPPSATNRRVIYRGIGLGWELTDAVRCDDGARRGETLSAFRRWANG